MLLFHVFIQRVLLSCRSQNSFTEENTLASHRRDESCIMLESIEHNPFRRFLTGEPFSIQSSSPIDLQNLNAQSFQNVFTRIFNSLKREPTESSSTSFLDKQPEMQQKMNETLCDDDDMPSSSGCSSASSTSGGDDNANSEDLIKMNIGETDNLTETKTFDSANEKNDLNDNTNKEEEEYVDDFYDSFPNDILDKLPDGLREVIAHMRENTHADIRQRHKESRITMMMMAEQIRNRKKAEIYAKMLGNKPPVILNGPSNPPINHSHHPCVDIGGLTKPLKFFPRKLKKEFSCDYNILVIDNTNVTLRKKGTSQINEDEPPLEPSVMNDSNAAVEELQEFNSHNFWYISPSCIDIENELKLLKSPDLPPQGNVNSYIVEIK